jgi:hypothetical protein
VRKRSVRRYADGGSVKPLDVAPDLDVKINSDDPSAAFQRQIDALRKAEQHVAQAATQPQHNLTPRQQAFLDANPEMLDQPERLSRALLDAHKAGHEPDSDAFHSHVAHAFRIQHLETAAHNKAHYQGHQAGTPEYKQAVDHNLDDFIEQVNGKPAPRQARSRAGDDVPSMNDRMRAGHANMASALAMRDRATGDTIADRYWSGGGERPTGRVRLSPEQVEAARISGVSLAEYAANVLRLREEKQNGNYTGKP